MWAVIPVRISSNINVYTYAIFLLRYIVPDVRILVNWWLLSHCCIEIEWNTANSLNISFLYTFTPTCNDIMLLLLS